MVETDTLPAALVCGRGRVQNPRGPSSASAVLIPKFQRVEVANHVVLALAVIGAGEFSCEWKGVPVNVNYKAGGKADGDLVSIEIH